MCGIKNKLFYVIGLTFTSPNWKTEPQDVVKKITSRDPNHPASSFYYREFETLPPIASFQFLKVSQVLKCDHAL